MDIGYKIGFFIYFYSLSIIIPKLHCKNKNWLGNFLYIIIDHGYWYGHDKILSVYILGALRRHIRKNHWTIFAHSRTSWRTHTQCGQNTLQDGLRILHASVPLNLESLWTDNATNDSHFMEYQNRSFTD